MDFKPIRKIANSYCDLRHVCLSVRLQQLCYLWNDFKRTWYMSIFRNSVEGIQVPLKPDKNEGYFTWKPKDIYDQISFSSL
jgi:hypothetical protein